MRRVRPWKWTPFVNPARTDDTVLHHWRRVADEDKEYAFAKFNKVGRVHSEYGECGHHRGVNYERGRRPSEFIVN